MNHTLDTVVIGGGAMGSAAAWALARRGRDVTLLEQFGPGHRIGASHGATRNLSLAYSEPDYVALLAETLRLWSELEDESGEQLLARTGVVNHGPDPQLSTMHAALNGAGLRADFLPTAEAAERWRGIRFDEQVLYMPDGGQLNPEAALPALQRLAVRHGAAVRHHVKVADLKILDDGVRLTVDDGGRTEVLTARQAVVTAGGWTSKLLAGAVGTPRLTVTQEQPAHFGIADRGAAWPGFNHFPGRGQDYAGWYSPVYGMHTPGRGHQGRVARSGAGRGSGPPVVPARAAAAGGPATIRPALAARRGRRLHGRHQLHLHHRRGPQLHPGPHRPGGDRCGFRRPRLQVHAGGGQDPRRPRHRGRCRAGHLLRVPRRLSPAG